MSQGGHIALGVLVGLLSTSIQSLGLTLQRKSHILEDEKESQEIKRPPYRRRRWQLGMLMFIVSNIVGSTIQITTLPLPVLSTLQAVRSGLVFNSICATLILGEAFTRWSLAGTILVSGGALLIALFGAISEPAHNLDQLLSLLGHRQFIIWIVSTMIVVVGILAAARFTKTMGAHQGQSPRARLLRGMAYGGVSGILSAHSLLVAKSAVELIVRSVVDHDNQFNRFPAWAILLGLLFLALSQLYYLHRGLKLCSTSVLYPFVFCVYNIIAILDGLIYFRQTSRLSTLSILLVTLGTVILLLGVVCLSWRLNQDPTTKPPINQGALTPGLGFVSSDTDSETTSLLSPTYEEPTDEESHPQVLHHAATLPAYLPSPHLPPAGTYGTLKPKSRVRVESPRGSSRSPNSLRISKIRRSRTAAAATTLNEADEIWGELEEEGTAPGAPYSALSNSPFSTARRRSFQTRVSTPSSMRARDTRIGSSVSLTLDATMRTNSARDLRSPTPDETTGLLRTSTGRSYRDRRTRRGTVSTMPEGGRRRSQNALGGWWKMRRWWESGNRRDGEDPGGGAGAGTENGTGNGRDGMV